MVEWEAGEEKNSSSPIVRRDWEYRSARNRSGGHEDAWDGSEASINQ